MRITFNRDKRDLTLRERGLDFADAKEVFAGRHATLPDDRKDYGEPRFISAGMLGERLVVIVWTPRGVARRIISMRHAHDKEVRGWRIHLDGPR
ncbi:BrnT family toxin [Roseomonas sp. USHLN139]|uniref:BrnT family toxin n=1 Tax=Roseomonas sp. USHLN139 TaxID=3081298 RepID=UPI003B016A20